MTSDEKIVDLEKRLIASEEETRRWKASAEVHALLTTAAVGAVSEMTSRKNHYALYCKLKLAIEEVLDRNSHGEGCSLRKSWDSDICDCWQSLLRQVLTEVMNAEVLNG